MSLYTLLGVGGPVGVAAAASTTFDPANKHSSVVLSSFDAGAGPVSNRVMSQGNTGAYRYARATQGRTSGEYFFEMIVMDGPNNQGRICGVCTDGFNPATASNIYPGYNNGQADFGLSYQHTGSVLVNGVVINSGVAYTDNDVIGFRVNVDTGVIEIYKNGVTINAGGYTMNTLPTILYPVAGTQRDDPIRLNAGQEAFTSPPAGVPMWG